MQKNNNMFIKLLVFILVISCVIDSPLYAMASNNRILEDKNSSEDKDAESESANLVLDDDNVVSINEIIEIRNNSDFYEFAKKCKSDSYSTGKKFILKKDLSLSQTEYDVVPYFNGVFDGNGHTISFAMLTYTGSDYGFFRYLGAQGKIENLTIKGYISVDGSSTNVGGIVGVNSGEVINCIFDGNLKGNTSVGGITGLNKSAGRIDSCVSKAVISATNSTGGIAGVNEGNISGCINEGDVNVDELESNVDVGAVDIGSLNIAKTIVNRNDTGGIAGYSAGTIFRCKNKGTVGYNHTGYNVGGIVGRQNGIVTVCTNEGTIYGRKDIGGIVGQAEPYVESEYLSSKISSAQDDINALADSVGNISATITDSVDESSKRMKTMTEQYSSDVEKLKDSLDSINNSISNNDPEAQKYIDEINEAISNIDKITETKSILKDYSLKDINEANYDEIVNALRKSQEKAKEDKDKVSASINSVKDFIDSNTVDDLQENIKVINRNLYILQEKYSISVNSTEEAISQFVNDAKNTDNVKNINDFADSIDDGFSNVMSSINNFNGQVDNIIDKVNDSVDIIEDKSGYTYINDVSTKDIGSKNGVIFACINNGNVDGDINIGGIAGSMNIEYENDPELELDFKASLDIALRVSVNDVIIHCRNTARVKSKRNCAGSILGNQEFGLVYSSEGYGRVTSDDGDYVGGIVGNSTGAIGNCYSYSIVSGKGYVGGIAGYGDTLEKNVSLSIVNGDGECIGSIAGQIRGDGNVEENCFSNDDYEGIDGITYGDKANRVTYEEIMKMPGIPTQFNRVIVTFELDKEEIASIEKPYGSILTEEDYPLVEVEDDAYVKWDDSIVGKSIENNITVKANYVLWNQSLSGYKRDKKSDNLIFVVEGKFYGDSRISMKQTEGPDMLKDSQELMYAYSWEIFFDKEEVKDAYKARFYVGDNAKEYSVMVRKGDSWENISSKVDGKYIVATIPYNADFAVIHTKPDYTVYIIVGSVTGVILLLIIMLVIRRKKKMSNNKK